MRTFSSKASVQFAMSTYTMHILFLMADPRQKDKLTNSEVLRGASE